MKKIFVISAVALAVLTGCAGERSLSADTRAAQQQVQGQADTAAQGNQYALTAPSTHGCGNRAHGNTPIRQSVGMAHLGVCPRLRSNSRQPIQERLNAYLSLCPID